MHLEVLEPGELLYVRARYHPRKPTRLEHARALANSLCSEGDWKGLLAMSSFPDGESREHAAALVLHASERAIGFHTEDGHFGSLMQMGRDERLPLFIRIKAHSKVEHAAVRAIEHAKERGNLRLLERIENLSFLKQESRTLASLAKKEVAECRSGSGICSAREIHPPQRPRQEQAGVAQRDEKRFCRLAMPALSRG